jgi:hypothetical protein
MVAHPAAGSTVTSPFGWRTNPITQLRRHHNGVDFGGTFAVRYYDDGVVVSATYTPDKQTGWGHQVTVEHANGVRTLYAHGHTSASVVKGSRVYAGQTVFTSGTTGASTGPHLHFELHRLQRGLYWSPVDPLPILQALTMPPATPHQEDEELMKIIKPFDGDERAVIGPGIGHAFGDWGTFVHFCNVWGFNPASPQVVGDASMGATASRALFYQIVAIHQPPAGTPAAIPVAALADGIADELAQRLRE